jgi:hypothetical protein
MSRLDTFIARLQAQKTLLEWAAAKLQSTGDQLPGPVIELGLGNGRTYDHLRELLPDRRIIAFDRTLDANPRSTPPAKDLILGDIRTTGLAFAERFGATAALLHADLGNGVPKDEAVLQRWLPGVVVGLVRPGAIVASSTLLEHPELTSISLPPAVPAGRYYAYTRR